MAKASSIEVVLTAVDKGLTSTLGKVDQALDAFHSQGKNSIRVMSALEGAVAGFIGAFIGATAISGMTRIMAEAGQAAYNLEASLKAANREFSNVGSQQHWEAAIGRLSSKLRVYSETDLTGAVSRTVDMTKRLGLSAEQMETVIALTGDLSAGKTDLEGGIERVTAALRGEAEASEYLGLTLNENYVKAWYEASGAMQGAWKGLTDLEKAQVRYNVFLEQAAPMQGRAAESVKTFAGAMAYAKKEINDAVTKNQDAAEAMSRLAETINANAGEIGALVSVIVTWAAKTVELIAKHQDLIKTILEIGGSLWVFMKAAQAIATLSAAAQGLNAAFAVFTGQSLITSFRALRAATNDLAAGFSATSLAFKGFVAYAAAEGVVNIARVGVELYKIKQTYDELAASEARGAVQSANLAKKYAEISAATGVTITKHQELITALKEGKIHQDEGTKQWVAGAGQKAAAEKAAAKEIKQVTAEALESMEKRYQDYVKEVQRLQGELVSKQRSLAAELREMGRSGMSESNAWRDQKKEAEEYMVAAKKAAAEAGKAMAAGDTVTGKAKFEEAVRLADDAKQAYKALNTEVKDGDQVVLSKAEALKTAMAGVKTAGELGISVLKQQQDAIGKTMDELASKAGSADLTKGMDEAEKKWLESWQRMRSSGTDAVEGVTEVIYHQQKEIKAVEGAWASAAKSTRGLWIQLAEDLQAKLDAATEARTVTVYTNIVEKRALGGLIGAARLALGGKLAGYGGGDRIPALLEAGEFVVRKEAVARFGAGLFDSLNNLRLPDLGSLMPSTPQTAAGNLQPLNIYFGGESIKTFAGPDETRRLKEMARRQRFAGNNRWRNLA